MQQYSIDSKIIKDIYEHLDDDISRKIFTDRLMYGFTEDTKYIQRIIKTVDCARAICDKLVELDTPIGIFGAGDVGSHLAKVWQNLPIVCFIDNKKVGKTHCGKPIVTVDSFLQQYPEGRIIISTKLYYAEIAEQLMKIGVDELRIINIGEEYRKLNKLQYFDLPEMKKAQKKQEVFIDGGAYDGETTVFFKDWCGGSGFSYVWEADGNNIEKCITKLGRNTDDYKLIPKGMWSKETKMRLNANGTGSNLSSDGDILIETSTIDIECERPVTFIKMDIEGSEVEALRGALNTIKNNRPKLAISIYHKLSDI